MLYNSVLCLSGFVEQKGSELVKLVLIDQFGVSIRHPAYFSLFYISDFLPLKYCELVLHYCFF